jgi:sulfate adenylyltransferase
MGSVKRNNELHIDKEAIATLSLLKEGIFFPVDKLMNQEESKLVDATSMYKNRPFPFSFILSPSGKVNNEVIKNAKKNDKIDIIVDGVTSGELIVEESFKIDPKDRLMKVFGTTDPMHPGVKDTYSRLGKYAISGEFNVDTRDVKSVKEQIQKAQKSIGAKSTTGIMMAAKPLHRGHERMIRTALENSDLVVIFLQKPYRTDKFSYELRHKTMSYFIDNYLPNNRVVIVPFENTYIFAGFNSIILDAIVAKNFGCDKLTVGQNHSGIGIYYDQFGLNSKIESFKNLDIKIEVVSEFVYCNTCKTLVSNQTCPHGRHHHINYNTEFMQELICAGVIPPAVLIRKEISALLLSEIFPNRFEKINKKFANFFPNEGILEDMNDEKFYLKLIDLHQTVSLT